MNKKLFFYISIVLFSLSIRAQIYNEDLQFKTQQEINNAFKASGKLHNIKTINGTLVIGDRSALSNISSLEFFSRIEKIEDGLYLYNNPKLKFLKGLERLSILSELEITGNEGLINFKGFENLVTVRSLCKFSHNKNVVSFEGLDKLRTVGEFEVFMNKNLKSCKGLENLQTIVSNLSIIDNESLESIAQLKLKSIGNVLSIKNNYELTSLHGLDKITTLSSIVIAGNNKLKTLEGLDSLREVSGVLIRGNSLLTSLKGLHNLKNVGDYLDIWLNKSLSSISKLKALEKVGGELHIAENKMLTTLVGLENLKEIGSISIRDSANLKNYCALTSFFKRKKVKNFSKHFDVKYNKYNPSFSDLKNSYCIEKK